MDDATRDELEARVRARFDAGDLDGAMSAAIEGYGPELFGFLVGLSRDATHADDVFGATCERLWKALPRFRWDSSFRVWAYTIARNEFLRSAREATRARRQVPLSDAPSAQQAIDRVRTGTPLHQRTEVKDRFAKLREQLDPDDHMLLGLRLDRRLGWSEIARILSGDDAAGGGAADRAAATLRKRFERLKARLRELARDA